MRGFSGGEPDNSDEENTYMKRTRGWRAAVLGVTGALGVGLALAAVPATPAQAHGEPNTSYKNASTSKGVSVDSDRNYDSGANQTTFTFTLSLTGSEPVSHVLLMACPDPVKVVSATVPNGANKVEGDTPKNDPSLEGEHLGIKFEPGTAGIYTIVFSGNIAAAQFVIKDGQGHAHFTEGTESDVCKTVTPQTPDSPNPPANDPPANDPPANDPPANNPPANDPPTNNPPANNPPANNPPANNPPANNPPANNPPANPASNQPSQPGTEVQGATITNNPPAAPSTDVLGAQQSQPEALAATLPRTGSELGLLAPLGAMLVAFGSVAIAAGRRSRV
jgi:hypothetical protein